MAEGDRHPSLGILEHDSIGAGTNVESAMAILCKLGLLDSRPGLCNGVAVALMHSTYLYEHQAAFPNVTKGLLDALSSLGLAFLKKLAAVDSYKRAASATAGLLSKEVAEVAYAVQSWAARQKWLLEYTALGANFANVKPPARVYEKLLRQVVGVLCLAGEETAAARLLEDLLCEVRRQRATTVADPKTTLQEAIAPITAQYTYERKGPDHETIFHASVSDIHGRRGTGVGRSKKLAAQNAALDFLRRHVPQALSVRMPRPTLRPGPLAIPEPRAHVLVVQQLRHLFALSESATSLLSQALIHPSWAYEHRPTLVKYHQQDNQVLAFVGAEAAMYEDILAVTCRIAANPEREFAFRTLDNEAYNVVFHRAGLASGLLLGTGQALQGISREMGATAFQAIVGAVFVAKGFPDSLAPYWPKVWASIWQVIVPAAPRAVDPTTLLQEAAAAMRLQTDYQFRRTGPDHASLYQATLALISDTLSIRTQIIGPPTASKVRAKHGVSTAMLRVLSQLARPNMYQELAATAPSAARQARFLLAHQAALIATSQVPLQRWVSKRLFGLHLASSPTDLTSWAEGADRLLDGRNTLEAAGPSLEEAFRAVLEGALQHEAATDSHLVGVLEALEQIRSAKDVSREHLAQLVQLCGVYRCIGADDPDTNMFEFADECNFLYRGRLAISPVPTVRLMGRERAILDAAVAAVLSPGTTAKVQVTSVRPLRVEVVRTTGYTSRTGAIAEVCDMWSRVTKSTSLQPIKNGIEVTIFIAEPSTEPGPITAAVLAALRPRPDPYQASVADILHDLKNQVVATRQAIAQSAENETARLEQQLEARRHLDRVHAMVLQLRAATSLLEPATEKDVSIELGAFLRNYGRAILAWLPENIALSTPGASDPTYVAIGNRALTAVLDNLMKNAAEAMPQGGSINLSWAADKYQAIIEVADDGPGLPTDITGALASGQRIHSTKPGGSGLGLLSVRSLLRRVGGQLSVASTSSGTAWEITLPVAAPVLEGS